MRDARVWVRDRSVDPGQVATQPLHLRVTEVAGPSTAGGGSGGLH